MEFMNQFNDAETQATFDPADVQKNKAYGIIAYLGILFLVPFLAVKGSAFAKFHANQGLNFLIATVVLSAASGIISFIPVLGILIAAVIRLAIFAVMIILMVCANKGMAVRLPVIGTWEFLK